MPSATSLSALPRPATFVKMEDRKRPAAGAVDDLAPPTKRQAVNGASKSKDDSADKQEEAWIEVSVTRQPCVIQPIKAPPLLYPNNQIQTVSPSRSRYRRGPSSRQPASC